MLFFWRSINVSAEIREIILVHSVSSIQFQLWFVQSGRLFLVLVTVYFETVSEV